MLLTQLENESKNELNIAIRIAEDKYPEYQEVIAIEKLNELSKELARYLRYGENEANTKKILEGMAVVQIMLFQLEAKFDYINFGDVGEPGNMKSDYKEILEEKIRKFKHRMED